MPNIIDNSELNCLIKKIVGLRLNHICLACEMMMFSFENYAIHTQCLTRIIRNNDILVTTLDYQSWDGENDKNNDEWYNLEKYKPIIENGTVSSVELTPLSDLIITLDNGITIQILIQNSYAHFNDEQEQFRFFEVEADDETKNQETKHKHYVIYSKHIEIN